MNELRVSVATYSQVVFPHPENGIMMLALERKATVVKDGSVHVRAQPFGGGVRILNSNSLKEILGEIRFDSERSKQEQDFRILIPPSQWGAVKRYCLQHLDDSADSELESEPDRELVEEFEETMRLDLKPDQYTVQPMGFVFEDNPVWTENWHARGFLTVRVYRTYKVQLLDEQLCQALLAISQLVSNQELAMRALNNNKGRANSVLVLSLDLVRESFLAFPPENRYRKIAIDNHELDESVLAILVDVDVPQYHRV